MRDFDTEIRHVTEPGANLFLELGFPPEEAERYREESRRQIVALLKRQKRQNKPKRPSED